MSRTLRKAYTARIKHSLEEAKKLVLILEKIQSKEIPFIEIANARGIVAKLNQTVNEASAYNSAYNSIIENKDAIAMSRPRIHKEEQRKKWK